MSTFRTPVGPESPNVYWRRRLVVGIGAVAVLVIILLIVFAPKGGSAPASDSTPAPSGSASAAPTSAAPSACDPNKLTVTALTDKTSYASGEAPQLSFSIRNDSSAPCTFTVGSDVQVFTITSGADTIWTSTDCQTGAVPATMTIEPGQELGGGPLEWNRTRSSKDTCDVGGKTVTAGGASYKLGVAVGGVEAKDKKQFLLL